MFTPSKLQKLLSYEATNVKHLESEDYSHSWTDNFGINVSSCDFGNWRSEGYESCTWDKLGYVLPTLTKLTVETPFSISL